jgi:hypothetical protein
MTSPNDIPPHRLAAIDQDLAELDQRLITLVTSVRAASLTWNSPDTHAFLALAAAMRKGFVEQQDINTMQLLLALAIVRLGETTYGR